jgi:hypothetical protein
MGCSVPVMEKERTMKGLVMMNTLGETSLKTKMSPCFIMKLLLVCVGVLP